MAPHANGQKKPPKPILLHAPLKLDGERASLHEKWAIYHIVPDRATSKKDAAKISVTRQLHHATKEYELMAPNVLVTDRQHGERYTIPAEGTATSTLYP